MTRITNTSTNTVLEKRVHRSNHAEIACTLRVFDSYEININDARCVIRALGVEVIDEVFTDHEQFERCAIEQNELVEPLLTSIDDRRLQFHGQLASLPKSHKRQRLVSSRAALYDKSKPEHP